MPYSNLFDTIKENIDAGLPLIGHAEITINSILYKHYLVIIGYNTGEYGTEQKVIVHDPYGDATDDWFDTEEGGESVTYPMAGNTATSYVEIDRVYTVHPVGIFGNFPGWQGTTNPLSQLFATEYNNTTANGGSGLEVFGIPFDNGKSAWVHEWPDANCSTTPPATCNANGIYLQDYLLTEGVSQYWSQFVYNTDSEKVFPVRGEILNFWNANTGYVDGPPIGHQYDSTVGPNSHASIEQAFGWDWQLSKVIGYDTVDDLAYTLIPGAATAASKEKETASDGQAYDYFGCSLGISGNKMIIGAYGDDDHGSRAGSAYIFEDNSGWSQIIKLAGTGLQTNDYFGYSVGISGSQAIVGAYGDDDEGSMAGAVYIFEKGASWQETAKLTPNMDSSNDGQANDYFGYSAAISGNYAVVGAYRDNGPDNDNYFSGAAYFFEKISGVWTKIGKKYPTDTGYMDQFGCSLAISGNLAVIGANKKSSTGSAYVFERINGVWTETQKLSDLLPAGTLSSSDSFGFSVAVSGNYIIVGAEGDNNVHTDSGSAFIFEKKNGSWTYVKKLTASDEDSYDSFGHSVAISDNYAIVGAYSNDDMGAATGAMYVFWNFDGEWVETEIEKLLPDTGFGSPHFSTAAAISGDQILVGAGYADDNGQDSGSAYFFDTALGTITWDN